MRYCCPRCGMVANFSDSFIAQQLGSLGGKKRNTNLSDEERSLLASKASHARWDKIKNLKEIKK